MGQITNNEFLASVLNAEVWKKVSDESLSMEMIEKFQDKLVDVKAERLLKETIYSI